MTTTTLVRAKMISIEETGVIRIPLTKGYVAIADAADLGIIQRHSWYAAISLGVPYAFTSIDQRGIGLHRILMGDPAGMLVDHKNCDTLDNRRSNLRLATKFQNLCNRGPIRNNATGLKGVRVLETRTMGPRFKAEIRCAGRTIHIGHFSTPEDAARAYDERAKELFGEFAWLNFPEETP